MNEKKYRSILKKDLLLIAVFVLLTANFMIFVLTQVRTAINSDLLKNCISIVMGSDILFLLGAAVSVSFYLKKNLKKVYEEDIFYAELSHK